MNKHWEKAMLKTLLGHNRQDIGIDLSALELFAGFSSNDAVLAAFIDEQLTLEQSQAVTSHLSTDSGLRQQWQHVLHAMHADVSGAQLKSDLTQIDKAQTVQSTNTDNVVTLNHRITKHWKVLGSIAASLAIVVITLPFIGQDHGVEPIATTKPIGGSGVLIEGAKDSAPVLANQAVPLDYWWYFINEYEHGGTLNNAKDESISKAFVDFTFKLSLINPDDCIAGDNADFVRQIRGSYEQLLAQYPEEFKAFEPVNDKTLCDLPKRLKQYADLAVKVNN